MHNYTNYMYRANYMAYYAMRTDYYYYANCMIFSSTIRNIFYKVLEEENHFGAASEMDY